MAVVTDTSSPFTKEFVESFWVLDNLLLRLLKDIKDFITISLLSHPSIKNRAVCSKRRFPIGTLAQLARTLRRAARTAGVHRAAVQPSVPIQSYQLEHTGLFFILGFTSTSVDIILLSRCQLLYSEVPNKSVTFLIFGGIFSYLMSVPQERLLKTVVKHYCVLSPFQPNRRYMALLGPIHLFILRKIFTYTVFLCTTYQKIPTYTPLSRPTRLLVSEKTSYLPGY